MWTADVNLPCGLWWEMMGLVCDDAKGRGEVKKARLDRLCSFVGDGRRHLQTSTAVKISS